MALWICDCGVHGSFPFDGFGRDRAAAPHRSKIPEVYRGSGKSSGKFVVQSVPVAGGSRTTGPGHMVASLCRCQRWSVLPHWIRFLVDLARIQPQAQAYDRCRAARLCTLGCSGLSLRLVGATRPLGVARWLSWMGCCSVRRLCLPSFAQKRYLQSNCCQSSRSPMHIKSDANWFQIPSIRICQSQWNEAGDAEWMVRILRCPDVTGVYGGCR